MRSGLSPEMYEKMIHIWISTAKSKARAIPEKKMSVSLENKTHSFVLLLVKNTFITDDTFPLKLFFSTFNKIPLRVIRYVPRAAIATREYIFN